MPRTDLATTSHLYGIIFAWGDFGCYSCLGVCPGAFYDFDHADLDAGLDDDSDAGTFFKFDLN